MDKLYKYNIEFTNPLKYMIIFFHNSKATEEIHEARSVFMSLG